MFYLFYIEVLSRIVCSILKRCKAVMVDNISNDNSINYPLSSYILNVCSTNCDLVKHVQQSDIQLNKTPITLNSCIQYTVNWSCFSDIVDK